MVEMSLWSCPKQHARIVKSQQLLHRWKVTRCGCFQETPVHTDELMMAGRREFVRGSIYGWPAAVTN
jgi:hypothetical protein